VSLLEQQELMESPPPRHVVVPERIALPPCWWGIDPSTTAYHIAYVFDHPSDGRRRGVHSVKLGDANVETTASAHWKKVATGHGRWNKTKPHPTKKGKTVKLALEEYGVMKWARANGYTGPSWDDADAWGIAEAARRDVEIRS
jgi:hypothetical protein